MTPALPTDQYSLGYDGASVEACRMPGDMSGHMLKMDKVTLQMLKNFRVGGVGSNISTGIS